MTVLDVTELTQVSSLFRKASCTERYSLVARTQIVSKGPNSNTLNRVSKTI